MFNKKIKYALLALVAVVAGIMVWYFAYWVKTPQYTLGLITTAVQKHDYSTFEKHVDMQNIYSNAYDDVVNVSFNTERFSNPLFAGLIDGIKKVAVPILIEQTKQYITTPEVETSADAGGGLVQDNGQAIVNNLKTKSGFNTTAYKGVESIEKTGSNAVVKVKVFDAELDKDFILVFSMKQLPEGTWRILKIDNLKDFIADREKAISDKLAKLNEPLAKEIAATVAVKPQGLKVASASYMDLICLLEADVELSNLSDKEVKYFTGNLELTSPEGDVYYKGAFASSKALAPKQTSAYLFNWELNKFLTDDNRVLQSDFTKIKWQAVLTSVVFADGTSLELLNELPNPNAKK